MLFPKYFSPKSPQDKCLTFTTCSEIINNSLIDPTFAVKTVKIYQIKCLRINSTLQFVSFFTIFPYGNEYNLASNLLFKYRGHRIRSGGHLYTLVLLRYQRPTFRWKEKSTESIIIQQGILRRIHFSPCQQSMICWLQGQCHILHITIQILSQSSNGQELLKNGSRS